MVQQNLLDTPFGGRSGELILNKTCLLSPTGHSFKDITMKLRDAKSPVSTGRLPFVDLRYGLPVDSSKLPLVLVTFTQH